MQTPIFPSNKLQIWLLATRPKTLPAAAASIIVGCSIAYHENQFSILPALACLLISILLQIGANFANDLFDFQRGADTLNRLGPLRVTQAGLLSPNQITKGMVFVFGLSLLLGIYLFLHAGWIVILIGTAAIIAALAYSGGPSPYGYYSLGDFFVFIFFGFVAVCGTYFVQSLSINTPSLWSGFSMGLLITNILVVNNLRDIETDRAANKITLAVRIGEKGTRLEYLICVCMAYLVPWFLSYSNKNYSGSLLTWLSMPLAIKLIIELFKNTGRVLNQTLARTAQLALLYAILFSAGIFLIS